MSKGIPVLNVYPGSHAERAGVRAGDVIISINGIEVNNMTDYVDAIKGQKYSRKMIIVRDGVSMDIEMIVGEPIVSELN